MESIRKQMEDMKFLLPVWKDWWKIYFKGPMTKRGYTYNKDEIMDFIAKEIAMRHGRVYRRSDADRGQR
eukprot:7453539-Karenia_brevis.AAC.1